MVPRYEYKLLASFACNYANFKCLPGINALAHFQKVLHNNEKGFIKSVTREKAWTLFEWSSEWCPDMNASSSPHLHVIMQTLNAFQE
jgi:hypothetical protein